MKILIILEGFLPGKKYGGPPVSVDNFCSLMKDYECYIVTTNHDMGESRIYKDIKKGWNDRGNCKVVYLSDNEYGYTGYKKIIEEIKPDIIYLQGLFQRCIIPCLILAMKYEIPVMLAPRGELCKGAFKKKYKKIPYIWILKVLHLIDNVHFQSTSDEETEAITGLLCSNKKRVHFLTNVPSMPKKDNSRPYKEPGMAKFVFISRIVRKKNLKVAISYFKEIEGDVTFDIYGPIEDTEYWKECQEEIIKLPDNVKVNYCGLLLHEQITEVFAKYHAFLFPTLSENFGHVIAEALSVGCPVIISNKTPWSFIEKYNSGFVCKLEDRSAFVKSIEKVIMFSNNEFIQKRTNAMQLFRDYINIPDLRLSYENALGEVMNKL